MTSFLTPFEFSGTETISRRLFRKKVLPVGSIEYNGRKIDFTEDYLNTMVQSFNDGAFDNIPLQFADADNRHTNDPERYRGDVVGMSLETDGLYVTVAATPKGAEILEENSKLGISARIINDYERADGKRFSAAMQHVLATHDPRIPGLGSWESVDSFSNSDESDIIDLTGSEFAKPVKKTKKGKDVSKKDENALSDAELARLRDFLAELDEPDDESGEVNDEVDADNELTDAELEALIASLDADVTDESETVDPEPELEGASLSNDSNEALELANQTAIELSKVREELAESKWANQRDVLMRATCLPPAVLDMAAPLLKGTKVVELSNGDKLDASKIMADVLNEIGKFVKLLDLSNELGSTFEPTPNTSEEAAAKRDETTKAVRAMMGN